MKFLEKLYFHKYKTYLRPKDHILLPPNKGSTFRGFFGYALKKFVCSIKQSGCEDCILKFKCVYSKMIKTPIPSDHPLAEKFKNIPHPYIIEPPSSKKRNFIENDLVTFNLITVGKTDECLPYSVMVIKEMEKIGLENSKNKFELSFIESIGIDSRDIINDIKEQNLKRTTHKFDFESLGERNSNQNEITLTFETPTRIKVKIN